MTLEMPADFQLRLCLAKSAMRIEQYTIRQLKEQLKEGVRFEERLFIPERRVLAQINNPRASDDDVVLFLGFEGQKIMGSLGVIPDFLFLDGERKQIGWLNNWNGQSGIGGLLFLKAMGTYGNRIGVSGFTEAAQRVCEGSKKFVTLKQKEGVSAYIRLNSAKALVRRFPWLRSTRSYFRLGDKVLNQLIDLRLGRWYAKHCNKKDYSVRYIDEVDEETATLIREVRLRELFLRGQNELNWMKKYPWENGQPNKALFLKIYDRKNNLVGFVFLKVAGESMTVPYYFCRDQSFDLVLKTIGQHLIEFGVNDLLVYSRPIIEGLRRLDFPVIHQRTREKLFLISKLYRDLRFADYHVHDGDGDAFI